MKSSLLTLVCILFGFHSFAQDLLILDKNTNLPISEVSISVPGTPTNRSTDANGKASLNGFPKTGKIWITKENYISLAFAWSDLEQGQFTVYLSTKEVILEDAVISANRWKVNLEDVAEKVRRLDQSSLLIRNPSNMADWIGSSGEVFIQKSQMGGGSPMIRGFSANRLLYAVDGVRMNTAIFRSGNLQNVISIDPFAVENTEIQFGPGSVMYGSDAIGGVMVFETLQPDGTNRLNLISRVSSASSEKTGHVDFSYGSNSLRFLTSISYFDYGDLRMGSRGGQDSYLRPDYVQREGNFDLVKVNDNPLVQKGSGYDQINLMQKVNWKSGKYSNFDVGFHYSTSSNVPRYDRLIEKRNGSLRFAKWDYGPQTWLMGNAKWTYTKTTRLFDQVKIISAYQFFEESRIDRRLNDSRENNRKEEVKAYSVNADLLKYFNDGSFLSYGAEWVLNQVQSSGISKNIETGALFPASARYPNSNWSSLAAYGSYHRRISDLLKFQGALRYNLTKLTADFSENLDFYPLPFTTSSNSHSSLTGNVGLILSPSPSFTISPVLSTGFRAPNVDDIGKIFDSEPGAVLVPNPDLKPEYAYNAELNLNKYFGDNLKLDFTAYYTRLDQAMVRRPFQLDGNSEIVYEGEPSQVLAIQNAAFATIKGIQAGFEYKFSSQLLLVSRYNFQKGIEELDDQTTSPSRHAPPAYGMTRLSFSKPKFGAHLTVQYSAERSFEDLPEEEKSKVFIYATDKNENPFSPSWTIVNLNFNYSIAKNFGLTGGLENIFDKQYRPYSSGIVAPGRNVTLSLKASF